MTTIVTGLGDLRRLLAEAKFPLVLKRDQSSGGRAVRIVTSRGEAEQAYRELRYSGSVRAAVKQAVKRRDIAYLGRMLRSAPAIALQQYVAGRPANRAVACWRGQVLGGLSAEALQTSSATGPATILRFIDCPEMEAAASRLVSRLGLSGFVGFDFVVEQETGRPYLIELNARPTQICHLKVRGFGELLKPLHQVLAPSIEPSVMQTLETDTLALFPQERWRVGSAADLAAIELDLPRSWPSIIDAYAQPVAEEPPFWTDSASKAVRNFKHLLRGRSSRSHNAAKTAAAVSRTAPISLP